MKAKRAVAVIISILFVSVMLFSHIFIIAEADHDCVGESCHICRVIEVAENTVKSTSTAATSTVALFAALFLLINLINFSCKFNFLSTLITLKVKLSY